MSNEDSELERLKARRLAEMQKNISSKKSEKQTPNEEKLDPRKIILQRLGYRGQEVLENAESQFPSQTKMIVEKLSELIQTGEIDEELDGGKLLTLFRAVGLHIRMDTKIHVEKDGKLISLSDKLGKSNDE